MSTQYPMAFKEFFVTDPETGEKKMRVQMFSPNGDIVGQADNEIDESDDENEIFQNWLNQYYEHDAMYDHPDFTEAYNVGPVHY